ncbi:DUF418 domain-containing protein [Streptosporangiaceae bacterium NEAU-GS5]|nr:DUF418 domain-containing protein [Streptosporangiaceae bacterium NEAU-GS5]
MSYRIREIDALRGFAVCGIMIVNAWQHSEDATGWVMWDLFQGRFYPIFAFLFGMSFALMNAPPLIMLRRMAVLALFGVVHWSVNPGEVLLPYSMLGAVALVPSMWLADAVVAGLGLALTAVSLFNGDPWLLIAGLLPLGMAFVRYGVRLRQPLVFAVSAALTIWLTWWWIQDHHVYLVAVLTGAVAYATGFLLLSPRIFEPLGKMALTCYLSSTAVILTWHGPFWLVSAVTLVAQWIFCRWWLSRYRYGPLEWVWRCLTWWTLVENRTHDARSPVPDPRRPRPEGEPGHSP